jgi:Outer membrane efflux protein
MRRFVSRLSIKLCVVMLLSAVGLARGDEALPSQDQALARALENHPDIVAAKAKVSLAEAELYGKRIEVSRQVLELYGMLKKLELQAEVSKAALTRSKAEFERLKVVVENGVADQSTKYKVAAEVQTAEAELVHAVSQREQAEKELRLLIGSASPAADAKSPDTATAVARQVPLGPIVEKMKVAEAKPIKLEFSEMPLVEITSFLTTSTGIAFSLQVQALEGAGLRSDDPITLNTSEVPLHAALQAFEDAYPEMQFVLRDYGVLLTTKESAESHGYVPVLELGIEPAATIKSR